MQCAGGSPDGVLQCVPMDAGCVFGDFFGVVLKSIHILKPCLHNDSETGRMLMVFKPFPFAYSTKGQIYPDRELQRCWSTYPPAYSHTLTPYGIVCRRCGICDVTVLFAVQPNYILHRFRPFIQGAGTVLWDFAGYKNGDTTDVEHNLWSSCVLSCWWVFWSLNLIHTRRVSYDTHAVCYIRAHTRPLSRTHKAAVAHMRGRCRVSSRVDDCFRGLQAITRAISREKYSLSLYIYIYFWAWHWAWQYTLSLSLSLCLSLALPCRAPQGIPATVPHKSVSSRGAAQVEEKTTQHPGESDSESFSLKLKSELGVAMPSGSITIILRPCWVLTPN
jgi:hypothetical protein